MVSFICYVSSKVCLHTVYEYRIYSEVIKMEHLCGKTSDKPKMFGGCEEAAKVYAEFKRILQSDEIQKMSTEQMDFKDPNVVAVMVVIYI